LGGGKGGSTGPGSGGSTGPGKGGSTGPGTGGSTGPGTGGLNGPGSGGISGGGSFGPGMGGLIGPGNPGGLFGGFGSTPGGAGGIIGIGLSRVICKLFITLLWKMFVRSMIEGHGMSCPIFGGNMITNAHRPGWEWAGYFPARDAGRWHKGYKRRVDGRNG
jgi:hypothetical protein